MPRLLFALLTGLACAAAAGPLGAASSTAMAGASAETRHVLVLHSYHKGYPFTDEEQAGFEAALAPLGASVETHVTWLDSKRLATDVYFSDWADVYARRFAGIRFAGILATDNDALAFLVRYRDRLFPGVPVFACGINNWRPELTTGLPGFHVVVEDADYLANVRLAKNLFPGLRRVVAVTDGTTTGREHRAGMERVAGKLAGLVTVEYLSFADKNFATLLDHLRTLGAGDAVFLLQHNKDGDGVVHAPREAVRRVVAAARVPVFVHNLWRVAEGAFGGLVVNGVEQGRAAAGLLARALAGERDLPAVTVGPNTCTFNHDGLHRFDVAESALPAGSFVHGRPVPFLEAHPEMVYPAVGLGGALVLVILVLLAGRRRQRRAARALADSEARYRLVADGMLEGLAIIQDRTIVFANPALESMLGLARGELAGRSYVPFVPAEHLARLVERQRRNLAGEPVDAVFEYALLRADGARIPVAQTAVLIEYRGAPASLVTIRDLEAQRRMEEAAAAHEARLRAADDAAEAARHHLELALDATNSSVFDNDFTTGAVRVTPGIFRHLGYGAADVPATVADMAAFIHPDDMPGTLAAVERHARGESPEYYAEFRMRARDGRWLWVNGKGQVTVRNPDGSAARLVGVTTDIHTRREAEERLALSEARFSAFMDHVPALVLIKDAGLRPVYANRLFRERLPADEWMGKTPEACFPPEVAGPMRAADEAALAEGYQQYEETWPSLDGEARIYETRKFRIERAGSPPLLGAFIHDITERRQAEAALRESEEKHRQVFDNAGDTIFIHDPEGWILAANAAATAAYGYSREEWVRMRVDAVDAPDDQAEFPARLARLLETGSVTFVTGHRRKDGTTFPVEVSARLTTWEGRPAVMSFCRDITERRRAEEELARGAALLRGVFQAAPVGICVMRDRRYVAVNEHWCRSAGLAEADLIGQTTERFYEDAAEYGRVGRELYGQFAERSIAVVETRLRLREGVVHAALLHATPLRAGDPAAGVVVVVHDIHELRLAEAAMRETVAVLRRSQEVGRLGDWKLDLATRSISGSPVAFELFGWPGRERVPLDELVARIDVRDRPAAADALGEAVAAGTPYAVSIRLNRADDGAERWIVSRGEPVRDADGRVVAVFGINQDITDLKQAEAAEYESERRYHALFETMEEGVIYHDAAGVVVNVNAAAERILGLSGDQLAGRTSLDPRWRCQHEDGSDYPGDTHPASIALRTGVPVRGAVMGIFVPERDEYRWAIVNAVPEFASGADAPSGVHVTITDVTALKTATDALRTSERHFHSLFNNMAEGVALHELLVDGDGNPVNYRLVDMNPQYERILGVRRADFVGKLAHEAYGTPAAPYLTEFGAVALSGVPAHMETYFPPMDKHFDISIAPWGEQGFATIFADVTARRKAEREQERLSVELLDKNRELESILYAASHDLRSPLVNIQGFGQRLAADVKALEALVTECRDLPGAPDLCGKVQDIVRRRLPGALGYITASASRMDALIAGLLRLSRTGRAQLVPARLDMDALVAEVLAAQRIQAERTGATVEVGPLPACLADGALVAQLFANLLDNALKYRHPERAPVITVEGHAVVEDGVRRVLYAVADNGPGIEPDHQPRIWELFHRLDPQHPEPGEGLGLTLVRRITDRHGGRVWVESVPGQGSRFCVALPAATE